MKLDLGCGKHKREGFTGVDSIAFEGVDIVTDLRQKWPFEDGSIEEAYASHVIEHFSAVERVHFVNELYRVLVPGGKATLIMPSWSSSRAYGDPTHQWPPMSPFWFFYLNKEWRSTQAPHTDAEFWPDGFKCDFEAGWGNGLHPDLISRNIEYQTFAITFYIEAVQDIHATLTRR